MELRALKGLREYYRALSDAARLRIVEQLAESDHTVTELARGLKMSQPLVSWHLRRLLRAGIVKMVRTGRKVRVSLDRTRLSEYARAVESLFAK
ncbi:MAG: winged helix-turn-helix transcriptional regulator [Chloroflexi bacterium]|nr:winged helix-turn-helix transcriptional regulator [Chloroflexota bacterium]